MAGLAEWLRGIAFQIDLAAAAIALIALVVSLGLARRQSRVEAETLRIQRDSDVIRWGEQAIDTLAKLEALAYLATELREPGDRFYERKIDLLAELSSLIDKGRMYFPNIDRDIHGTHKDGAFRGYRRPILDALYDIHGVAKGFSLGNNDALHDVRRTINLHRRKFVSELQKAVDPDRRLQFLAHQGTGYDVVIEDERKGRAR